MFPFDQQSETRADLLKLMEIALENATRGVLPIALRLELRDIVSLLVYQAYQSRHEGEPEQKAISVNGGVKACQWGGAKVDHLMARLGA